MSIYQPLFKSLNKAGVRYVVVGGIAVILHGYVRATTDVDLVVDLQADEAGKVIDVLSGMGYQPRVPVAASDFTRVEMRERWIAEKGMQVFSMNHPDSPFLTVDLFVNPPIPLAELWPNSLVVDYAGTRVRVCSLDDLIRMKELAGRNLDSIDLERLRKLRELAKHPEIKEAWPVSYQANRDAQLASALQAEPAQRLAMAEELQTLAGAAPAVDSPSRAN